MTTYQLGYSMPSNNATTWLTAYTASWMAPHYEGRISWQGARMGMYATGNGVVMLEEAVFRHVEVVRGPYQQLLDNFTCSRSSQCTS